MSKQTFWEDHIRAWQASGRSQRTYCQEQAISLASFGYWRRKLRPAASSACKGLVPITMAADRAGAPPLEVMLPNRLTLRVPWTAEPSQVTRWVQALVSC